MSIKKRILGRTRMEISEIGFGAWAIGGNSYGMVEESQAKRCLHTYIEAGGNFIDKAKSYALSEKIIGDVLRESGLRDKLIIATKTPNTALIEMIPGIRKDLENSLRLLGKDYVDLYYLHNPPDDPDVMHRVLEEFLKLKEEGKIRAIGASIKGPDVTTQTVALCRQYIETGHVDAIQLIYSIFRQKTAEVFKQAYHSGVGIVARTVLENGFLTGKYKPGDSFSDNDHRRRWGNAKIYKILEASHHVQSIAIQSPYETITQTAIAFSLASKYVTTAIVGAKTEDQVIKNVALAKLPPLDKSIISRLQHEYDGKTEMFNIGENNNTH